MVSDEQILKAYVRSRNMHLVAEELDVNFSTIKSRLTTMRANGVILPDRYVRSGKKSKYTPEYVSYLNQLIKTYETSNG